jgi:trehalose 6-phosphate phosphatase
MTGEQLSCKEVVSVQPILSPSGRRRLREFVRAPLILGFDYDGTLAPLVASPSKAVMRTSTARLLRALARRYPCAIVSGRGRRDLQRRVRVPGMHALIGSHGVEPWDATPRTAALVSGWREALAEHLPPVSGIVLEDKTYSLALHYRQCRVPGRARRAILKAASSLQGARIVTGKLVVNVVPVHSPHKGEALRRIRAQLGCARAFYVGDDHTDDDVFNFRSSGRLLGVRIGRRRSAAPPWYLPDQRDIDELLQFLIGLRPAC